MQKQAVLDAMRRDIGQESEPGEWFVVTQKLIDDYVELTGETFEGDKISEIDDNGSSFDVRMRIDDKDRLSAEDLSGVAIMSRRGQQITLGNVAAIVPSDAPSVIERFDGQRQITVVSNYKGKDLNAAANQIQAYVDANMPTNMNLSLSGQTEIMKQAIFGMLKALGLAILLVLMILCAQYERYLAPLVIIPARLSLEIEDSAG